MPKLLYLIAAFIFFASAVRAEDINITAEEKVEWHQAEQKMVAVGNAVASQKGTTVRADTMTAWYDKIPDQKTQKVSTKIKTVHAVGAVVITTPTAKGFGNTLDYDIRADTMTLTGSPAKIKTPKETITATESIVYYPSQDKAVARGNVKASDAENQIFSDYMVAFFEKDARNQTQMNKVEIHGNVKIITKSATVHADRGLYLPRQKIAKLYDNVRILQDGNLLKGDYAQTDMNTGISRLLSDKKSGGRVSGVFKEKDRSSDKSAPSVKE